MIDTDKTQIIEALLNCESICFGDYTLKNGKFSPIFIDVTRICKNNAMQLVSSCLAKIILEKFPQAECLYGPAYKGIVLATATATISAINYEKQYPIFFDRKEEKQHGDGGLYFGAVPQGDNKINTVIIDDVITDGGTKISAIKKLQQSCEATVCGIVVVVDRRPLNLKGENSLSCEGKSYPLHSLIDLQDISDFLQKNSHPYASMLIKYLKN